MDANMRGISIVDLFHELGSPEAIALACSTFVLLRPGALLAALKGVQNALRSAGRLLEPQEACADLPATPIVMMRSVAPPNFWEREVVEPRKLDEVLPSSQLPYMQYSNSGAFQEVNASWDRPSATAPKGPAHIDTRANKPTGGKPDWYQMISDKDKRSETSRNKNSLDEDEEISKVTDEDLASGMERAFPWELRSRTRARNLKDALLSRDVDYSGYLQLNRLLSSQQTQSGKWDTEEHDELLFIIIHQTYELWFKQILYELDSIHEMFASENGTLKGSSISNCGHLFGRVTKILRTLVQQFDILETMDAQAFHDFRDFLAPASGFQSKQFRMIENSLGLSPKQRIQHSGCPYFQHLRIEDRDEVLNTETKPSILCHVGKWLEAILADFETDGFRFADYMRNAIQLAAEHDRAAIQSHSDRHRLPAAQASREREELERKLEAHVRLFDEEEHNKLIDSGIRQLSFKATMGCVFVHSFRQEPALAGAHRVLTHLVETDELLAQWRQRHANIVLRMIGSKSGTGGSSGHAYLNQVLGKSRIFIDLCHSMHYLLPQHALPSLPPPVLRRLAGDAARGHVPSEVQLGSATPGRCNGGDC